MVSSTPLRVVVLVSGSGSNLQALLDDQQDYTITAVVADRATAYGLQRALAANVATICLPLDRPQDPAARAQWETTLAALIVPFAPDLLVLAGWMRVLSPAFIARFPHQIINQHPALLPPDDAATVALPDGTTVPALRGAHAVRAALQLGLAMTGCTVHRVTATVDVGPILAQQAVPINDDDTATSLHERIKQVERTMLVAVVRQLAQAPR